MKITNEPLQQGQPVKFVVKGFPIEESIKSAIERFYKLKPDAEKEFLVLNEFKETIFTGQVDESGFVKKFEEAPRPH